VFGTPDDDLFDTIDEVDAQYYVGGSALGRILDWATTHGWIPAGDDIVGSWEGVDFTADEVTWTLELANTATQEVLDHTVGLDRRAAAAIVIDRPFFTMDALAATYYVGRAALRDLRDYAAADQLGGPWDTCSTAADCQEGLVCMGEIVWGVGIYCVDDSMYGTFVSDEEVAIPDDGSEVSTSLEVEGLATVPIDVVLTIDVDHPRMSDLILSISNFAGYGESLWLHDADPEVELVVRAFPSDDMVNGTYTVTLIDDVPGEAGTLRGWELYVVSNWD
jgi:hypothetical protein